MKIRLVCIGKLKEKYWKEACREYSKRLSAYCNVETVEIKESPSDDIDEEGERILSKIKDSEYVITCEIKGNMMDSEELAASMEKRMVAGTSDIVFVIGGSNGLAKAVSKRSNLALSFSKMTFPHQMMRVILLEQIYRSFKIIRHEKYHK